MNYPGHLTKIGETNPTIIAEIVGALANHGYQSNGLTGIFDKNLAATVMLFQTQHHDGTGRPLKADGQVGPLTWAALFSTSAPANTSAAAGIGTTALAVAITQIGVREQPLGSNRGPEVDQYLASVNTPPENFWCMAFVYWCHRKAAQDSGLANPFPKTAGCLDAWNRTPAINKISRAGAIASPTVVRPGMVFILDFGGDHGHTGFVRENRNGALITVEGNSDPAGGDNGIEVLQISRRSVMDKKLKGFIAF